MCVSGDWSPAWLSSQEGNKQHLLNQIQGIKILEIVTYFMDHNVLMLNAHLYDHNDVLRSKLRISVFHFCITLMKLDNMQQATYLTLSDKEDGSPTFNSYRTTVGERPRPTCLDEPRPSAQVWDPLEYSLQVLDKDSSLPLQLLRGQVRLSRLGHLPEATPDFPFFWISWEFVKQSPQHKITGKLDRCFTEFKHNVLFYGPC